MNNKEEKHWIVGKHAVHAAIKEDRPCNQLLLVDGIPIPPGLKRSVPVKRVHRKKLDGLAEGARHQGMALSVASQKFADLDTILEKTENPFLVVLQEITDPHNLGAILRSADATGVHAIIIPKRRAVGLTPAVAKTAAGAMETVPVVRVSNMTQTLEKLKKRGLWIVGADAGGSKNPRDACLKGPLCIVIGSEGSGLSHLVKKTCDEILSLPMGGSVSSLNASVSAGVFFYEAYFQRKNPLRSQKK